MSDFINMNFDRAKEIIGDRTPEEIVFDKVVVKELKKGRSIIKALKMANKKYPDEALQWSDETIEDITLHYEYLMQHEDILKGFKRLSN